MSDQFTAQTNGEEKENKRQGSRSTHTHAHTHTLSLSLSLSQYTWEAFILVSCDKYENISCKITVGRLSQDGPWSSCAISDVRHAGLQDEQLFAAHSIDSCPSHFLDVASASATSASPFPFPFLDAVATAPLVVVAALNFSNRTSDVSSQARIMFSQPIGQNREPSATPFDLSPIAAAGAPFTAETGIYIYIYIFTRADVCTHRTRNRDFPANANSLSHARPNCRGSPLAAVAASPPVLADPRVCPRIARMDVYTHSRAEFTCRLARGGHGRPPPARKRVIDKDSKGLRKWLEWRDRGRANHRELIADVQNAQIKILLSLQRQRSEIE